MARPTKKVNGTRSPIAANKEANADTSRRTPMTGNPTVLQVVAPVPASDPEVAERAARRRFTAEYKLGILRQADACAGTGELGALLRREGLYSSHLTMWRRQREQGSLAALTPKKRGRLAVPPSPLARRVAELERENTRLSQRLQQAETIIAVQKKLSEALGLSRPDSEPSC
jgi:transposase-like protein